MTLPIFKGLLLSFSLTPQIYIEYLSMFKNIEIQFQKQTQRDHVEILRYEKIWQKYFILLSTSHSIPTFPQSPSSYSIFFLPHTDQKGLDPLDSEALKTSRVLQNFTKTIETIRIYENGLEISPQQAYFLLPFVAHEIFLQYFRSKLEMINSASCPKETHIPGLATLEEKGYPNNPPWGSLAGPLWTHPL